MTAGSSGCPDWRAARSSSSTFTRNPAKPRLREDDRELRESHRRRGRTARRLCAAGARARFRASRTRRTRADARRSSNTATTATTSPRTGCRRRTTARRRGRGVRRRLRLRRARAAAQERAAHHVVHRLEQLHARLWRPGEGRRGDEAVRRLDGAVGFPHAAAEEGVSSARRAAGNPLGVGREAQLRLHRHGAHLEALALLRGRERRMAGEGSRHHRRRGRRAARGHQPERR